MRWWVGCCVAIAMAGAGPAHADGKLNLPAMSHLSLSGGKAQLAVFHLMSPEKLQLKKKKWWVEGLKELDVEFNDGIVGFDFEFSSKKKEGRLHLSTSAFDAVGFGVKTDVVFTKGKATVRAQLRIADRYQFVLPDVTIVPKSFRGQRYVEYQLPFLKGTF